VFIEQLLASNGTLVLNNVTLACAEAVATPPATRCTALAVDSSSALDKVLLELRGIIGLPDSTTVGVLPAEDGTVHEEQTRPWHVLLSLTAAARFALPSEQLQQLPLQMADPLNQGSALRLEFYGPPGGAINATTPAISLDIGSGATVLHMGGVPGLFIAGNNGRCPHLGSGSIAFFDLTLTGLPYPEHVARWLDLTSVAAHVLACDE
jgi:hypothetical protein